MDTKYWFAVFLAQYAALGLMAANGSNRAIWIFAVETVVVLGLCLFFRRR